MFNKSFISKMNSHEQVKMFLSLLPFFSLPFLLHAASIATDEEFCPVSNSYCTCSEGPFFIVNCKNISDFNTLHGIVANFSDTTFIFELGLVNWKSFPVQALENPHLKSMVISNSTFDSLFNTSELNAVSNTSVLNHLSLENISIAHDWSWSQLSFLKKLDIFFAYNASIGQTIPSNFSQHMSKSLKFLSIAQSNISTLEPECFKHLNNLTYLRISHSNLRNFSRNTLPSPSNLTQLRLDHNSIASLPEDMFQDMPDLAVLSLSNNRLSVLSEDVFRPIWKSKTYIELRNNPIKCDCRMRWIVTTANKPNVIGECAHPKKLFGREIAKLTERDLSC